MLKFLKILLSLLIIIVGNTAYASWDFLTAISTEASPIDYSFESSTNASGYTVALWTRDNETAPGGPPIAVESATLSVGGTWSAPSQIISQTDSINFNFIGNAAISVDPAGNAVAIFYYFAVGSSTQVGYIQAAYLPYQGNWTSPVTLVSFDPSVTPIRTKVGTDQFGNATAAWILKDGTVQTATYDFQSGNWSAVMSLNPSPVTGINAGYISTNASGGCVIGWMYSNNTMFSVTKPTQNAIWTTPESIATSTNVNFLSAVNLDAYGNAIATIQYDAGGGVTSVQTTYRPVGGTWGALQLLNSGSSSRIAFVRTTALGFDGLGNAIAIYFLPDGPSTFTLWFKTRPFGVGGTWSSATLIVAGVTYNTGLSPAIVVNQSGQAIGAWTTDNPDNSVYAATYTYGGVWSAPENLGSAGNANSSFSPQTAFQIPTIDQNGNGVVVWLYIDPSSVPAGTKGFLFASSMNVVTPPQSSTWSFAETISNALASLTKLAVDKWGNAVAVWNRIAYSIVDNDNTVFGPNTLVEYSTLPFLGQWKVPKNISGTGQVGLSGPDVGVDASGNAVFTWTHSNGSNYITQAGTLPFQGYFQGPSNISLPGSNAETPVVAVDSAGNAVAVWLLVNNAATSYIIQSAVLPFGGSWSAIKTVSNSGSNPAGNPKVVIDSSGNAVAIWEQSDGSNSLIMSATLDSGAGAWSAPVAVSVAGQNAGSAALAINANEYVVAVWERSNGSNLIIQSATLQYGGGWSVPVDISSTGYDSINPQVAIDSTGNAIAVWSGNTLPTGITPTSYAIQSSQRPYLGSWTSPMIISSLGYGINVTDPQIVMNPAGQAVATWAWSGGFNIIQSAHVTFGGVWSNYSFLSSTTDNAFNPTVGVDYSGKAVAAWTNELKGIQASRSSTLFVEPTYATPLPPSDFVGQTYVVYLFATPNRVHRLTWEPSQDASVVAYNIYRNASLIATVPVEGPYFYDDPNRSAGSPDTYVLRAVNAGAVESTPDLTLVLQ